MSGVQGGKFWSSFASGAISSLAASAFQFDGNGATEGLGWANSVRGSTAGMIGFGTIMGGVGAAITKGNFWQGAVTGFIVSALNHAMHDGDNGYDENGNKINDKGGDETDYLYKDGNIIDSKPVAFKGAIPSNGGPLRGYGFRAIAMDTGAIQVDNSIFEWFAGGKIIGSVSSSFKFVGSKFVFRSGGQSTFKIGLLHKSSKTMLRLEKHSLPLKAGGRAYPTHFNLERLGHFNYHFFPNPLHWGKFKVN